MEDMINDFATSSKTKFPFINNDTTNTCNLINEISCRELAPLFKKDEIQPMFEEFYISHSLLSKFMNADIVEELLIEFNNFLSHYVKHIVDEKLTTGISHLYRGCLDAYKEIILSNIILLLSDDKLREKFINLRIDECNKIGIKEIDKTDLVNSYKEIAENLITLNG